MTFGNTASSTGSRGKEIKYVLVEMIMAENEDTKSLSTKEKDTPILGLLRGAYNNQEGTSFISIATEANKIENLNLGIYNVLMLEIFDGLERELFFCRADEEDQTDIMNIIKATLSALKNANRMTANEEIVDISTYSELPKAIDKNDSTASKHTGTGVSNAYSHTRSGAHTDPYYKPPPPKEKKPTAFKRTSEVPQKEALNKMKEMVLKIATGTFEEQELNFPDNTDEDEKDSTSGTQSSTKRSLGTGAFEDDDFYGQGGIPFC